MKDIKNENVDILIVDDTPKNLQVLGNILRPIGYNVEFATNGVQAIEWLDNKFFDIILLDIMMPEMDGFTVCQNIRKKSKYDDMPIIFLTAKTDKESIVKGFKLGGQDYITKPFDSHELLARVETHLELKFSKEKLKDLNKWLEEQVALRTEELEIAYHELELLDIAKIEFLKILSHEIRTPLNGIKGFTQLLKMKVNSENLMHYIDVIELSSDRLERFSNIALLISSLRTKRHPIKIEELSIDQLIKNVCTKFAKHLQSKSVEVKIKPPNKEFILEGDLNLLNESFNQLIENAIIFSHDDSVITIGLSEDEQNVIILIKDKGPGFSEDALVRIFQPFGLGQDHIDKKVGLGLHLVKLIMETHKASINIGNNKDGGSYVGIIFPKKYTLKN